MTGDAQQHERAPLRRATVRTTHEHAAAVAASLVPDNTDEMRTAVVEGDEGRVETVIERETTGGLRTTADDYVTNLQVAEQLTTDETTDDAADDETTDDTTDRAANDDTNHDDDTTLS